MSRKGHIENDLVSLNLGGSFDAVISDKVCIYDVARVRIQVIFEGQGWRCSGRKRKSR